MSENRQMERKLNMPAPKSAQGSKTDGKKSTDVSSSKFTNNRRNGKSFAGQPQKADTNRGASFKKTISNYKQPQPRASLFCGKKGSEVIESLQDVGDDDIMLPTVRHWNQTRMWNSQNGPGCSFRKKAQPPKFNIKHFLIANCQFVVKAGKDYGYWISNQDEIVNWEYIEQIKMFSTQAINCPICMDIPTTPKMTSCGHIYCWPCILRYLDINKELDVDGCPICHSRILKKELQSVELIINEECSVGQSITLQLMKRARNSLQAYPIAELGRQNINLQPTDNSPLSVSESNFSTVFSRILVANKNEILNVLNKEREALVSLLDYWETEDVEKKYIFEALELLSTREDILMNDQPILTTKELEDTTFVESFPSTSLGTSPLSCVKNLFDISGCSSNIPCAQNEKIITSNYTENINDKLKSVNFNEINETPNKSIKKDFYFYQAVDGQHIYLSAINVEMLEKTYGNLENSPQLLTAIVKEKQYLSMTEALRKRYRFLLHLPITTVFEWVEIDMTNLVSPDIFELFKSNLDERTAIRDRRAREEQRLAKRIEERNQKKQIAPPEWQNRDIFPQCGYDPFADESMIPLSESIGMTSSSPVTNSSTTSHKSKGSANLSFAKALQNENISNVKPSSSVAIATQSSQWPSLGSTANATSMNEVLEEAVANMSVYENGSHKSKNKKKKRCKYEPIL
ncbi:RING finger protein 10 [Adelges cooleyi]|uniref:RING finger protein 10 n=1 Tax=Adelges cooleyi TaxID=133065 RepID=UPI00217F66C0|nr:RING finger protein 10 [Adelges cooleyi]